jgi:hypothetical protein
MGISSGTLEQEGSDNCGETKVGAVGTPGKGTALLRNRLRIRNSAS